MFQHELGQPPAMNIIFVFVTLMVVFGSPLWTSALIMLLPRRRLALSFAVVGIQAVLAYALWWFFGGVASAPRRTFPTSISGSLSLRALRPS